VGSSVVKPGVSINAVMVALVDHAGHELWEAERDGKAPKTDAHWRRIEEHAVQLVAAGPAITVGGTGVSDGTWVKSPDWTKHAQALSDSALKAVNASKAKNLEALATVNRQLVDSCEGCHKQFKPELPTEGIVHTHAPGAQVARAWRSGEAQFQWRKDTSRATRPATFGQRHLFDGCGVPASCWPGGRPLYTR
jgi:cytochrome c556